MQAAFGDDCLPGYAIVWPTEAINQGKRMIDSQPACGSASLTSCLHQLQISATTRTERWQ
jgi:hypothetical protein